jgi:hypothetical protein
MANEVEIPLKLTGVGNLKTELRILKDSIAEASDPQQMSELVAKAAELADKIKDANEQVAVFTTGSKFEAISNSFNSIQGDLAALDFEGAAEKAATFQKTVGSLGKSDITGAIKGLGKTVTTLGSTFVKLGIKILVNPIFLLAAHSSHLRNVLRMYLNNTTLKLPRQRQRVRTPLSSRLTNLKPSPMQPRKDLVMLATSTLN